MKSLTTSILVLAMAFAFAACGEDAPEQTDHEASHETAHGDRSPTGGKLETDPIPYRAKGSKPALTKPEFRAADDVPLPDGLNVIGVVINGEAKAYPTFILNQHQVVNDWLGGVPIAPSW